MPANTEPRGLFVTGTNTGVGKTVITAALALLLRRGGVDVGVMKPLETGVEDLSQAGEDGALLRWAAASSDPVEHTCPYRFTTPAAPATAARLEKRAVNYTDLVTGARQQLDRHRFTLVEGAGGLMVPVAGGFLVADLARDMGLPLLVVADARLGTINHSLLTLLAARYLEIEIAGYILNRMPAEANAAEKAAPHDLASLTIEELLAVVPEVDGKPHLLVGKVADCLPQLPSWPLLRRYLPRLS